MPAKKNLPVEREDSKQLKALREMSKKLALLDERPIEVGGFLFRSREAIPVPGGERPTKEGLQAAIELAEALEDSSPYWVADLHDYAESRADWKAQLDQILSITKLAKHTIENRVSIGRKVKGRARVLSPSIAHSGVVAKLEPKQQEEWLEQASDEGWTVSELNKAVRSAERTKVIEGQAALAGMYRVIYADPPWNYNDSGIPSSGALGKASRHYSAMSIEDLCKLPVESHALEDSVLFLWIPAPFLLQNPGPREVIEAWGFTYKTGAVWDKVLGNWGHYFRIRHEHVAVCTRGSCMPDVPTPMPDSILTERRSDEHSEKPESMRQIISKLYTRGPYLELFGRKKVEGWDVFGNDARLWSDDARAASA